MKILLFFWAFVICEESENVKNGVKINTFWAPPVCVRQVHKGDFVR